MNFKKFLENTGHVGSYWTGTNSNTNTNSPHDDRSFTYNRTNSPTFDSNSSNFGTNLLLPSVTKTGRISSIETKKNPIIILMDEGTRLFLTYDQFKKIKGDPQIGKTMTVVFQRRPDDMSEMPSKVDSITCH